MKFRPISPTVLALFLGIIKARKLPIPNNRPKLLLAHALEMPANRADEPVMDRPVVVFPRAGDEQ